MSTYTPPNTFTTGTLEASDLNENLDELSETIAQGFTATADIADGSISTEKILRPRTQLVTDRLTSTQLETGSIHHLRLPAIDYISYDPLWNIPFQAAGFVASPYHNAAVGQPGYRPVPGTWISFWCSEAPLAVLVRVMGEIIVPVDNTGSTSVSNFIMVQLDSTQAPESMCRVREQTATNFRIDRRHFATCAIFTGLTAGWHHVGLVCGWTSNFGLQGGMELTCEVFN